MEIRTVKIEELETWYDHVGAVFADTGRQYFVNHVQHDASFDPDAVFVAWDGDTIASTMRVFDRKMYLRGKALRVGGIGEVSTKPQYRKQGLSNQLLQLALRFMQEKEYDFSALYTGVNNHYARVGYRDVPIQIEIVDTARLEAPEEAPRTLAPEAREARIAELRALYDMTAPQLDGAVVRDSEDYWRRWVLFEQKRYPMAYIEAEGRMAAYLLGEVAEGGLLSIREFASLPEYSERIAGMARGLAEANGATRVQFQRSLNLGLPAGESRVSTSMMVRLMRPLWLDGQIDSTEALVEAFARPISLETDGF